MILFSYGFKWQIVYSLSLPSTGVSRTVEGRGGRSGADGHPAGGQSCHQSASMTSDE